MTKKVIYKIKKIKTQKCFPQITNFDVNINYLYRSNSDQALEESKISLVVARPTLGWGQSGRWGGGDCPPQQAQTAPLRECKIWHAKEGDKLNVT